jgi:hypothetical protein
MHPVSMSQQPPVTRKDVEIWWSNTVAGKCSTTEAANWAESELGRAPDAGELVLQALLTLQSLKHSPESEDKRTKIAQRLALWRAELRRYDADPEAWNRTYFQHMLLDFANRFDVEKARAFGNKLIAAGQLKIGDVDDVLP